MAENPIKKEDIIDGAGIIKQLREMIAVLEELKKTFTDITPVAKQMADAITSANPATKEGQESIKKYSKGVEELTLEQKAQASILKQLESSKTRLLALERAEAKEVERNKMNASARQKQIKEEIGLMGSQEGSLNRLRSELKKQREEYDKLGPGAAKKASAEIKKLSDQIEKQEKAVGSAGRGVGKYADAIKGAASQFLGFATAAGGALMAIRGVGKLIQQSIKDFAEFETGQLNIQSLLEQRDETLSSRSIAVMKKYGLAIADVNKALFDAVSAGIPAAEATEFLDAAAKLAISGVTTLSVATDGLTTIINSYGLSVKEASKVADAFFSAQKFGKTTVAELSSAIGSVAPVAKAAGISYQELLSTFAELTKQGISTDETATTIRATIQALIAPTKEAKEAFDLLGIETGITAVKQNGLMGTLKLVAESIEGNEDALVELIPNVRALVGVASLTEEAMADYDAILKSVVGDTGEASSASKALAEHMGSVAKQTDITKAALTSARIELGQQLSPAVNDFRKSTAGLFEGLANKIKDLRLQVAWLSSIWTKEGRAGLDAQVAGILGLQKVTKDATEATEKQAEVGIGFTRTQKFNLEELKQMAIDQAAAEKKAADKKVKDASMVASTIKSIAERRYDDEQRAGDDFFAQLEKDIDYNLETIVNYYDERGKKAKESMDQWAKDEEWLQAESVKRTEKTEEDKQAIRAEYLEQASNALNIFGDLFEASKQRELSAAGDNAEKRAEIEKKYLKRQQLLGISQALINGAIAVTEIQKKWAAFPGVKGVLTALSIAQTLGQVAVIKSQKFAKGGSGMIEEGVLQGNLHSSGGVNLGAIGEAEKGEYFGIINRQMTQKYSDELPAIFDSINKGSFHEVWSNVNNSMSGDPYTRKMYELMASRPASYIDSDGNTVLIYDKRNKKVLKKFNKN